MDARPCFDPTGKLVLFMHQPLRGKDKNQIWFYSIPTASAKPLPLQCQKPNSFYVNPQLQATRPDWSWTRNSFEIAFAGFPTSSSPGQLWLLDAKTKNAQQVNCTANDPIQSSSYPSWNAAGDNIVLTDYAEFDPTGKQRLLLTSNIDETPPSSVQCTDFTNPDDIWPGMCSVSPSNPNLVAFAGQAPNLINTYDQNWNQIWVKDGSGGSATQLNGILGRAPWWSPTGNRIAYESILTPTDGYNSFYRIWVIAYKPPVAPPILLQPGGQLVTPPNLAVQHAKWSPDGKKIVFAYNIPWGKPVDGNAPMGIAIVDAPT